MSTHPVIKIEAERVFTIIVGSQHLGGMRETGRTTLCSEYENDSGERLLLMTTKIRELSHRFKLVTFFGGAEEMPDTVVLGGSPALLQRIGILPTDTAREDPLPMSVSAKNTLEGRP